MQPHADEKLLRQYLLETLDQSALEDIDVRIIEDEEFSQLAALAESDLVEDYLDDLLSLDEVRAFQSHFLSNPERKQLLREISDFRSVARHAWAPTEQNQEVRDAATKGSWFFRPLILVPAFGAIVLAAFLIWQLVGFSQASPLEKEYASINRRDLSEISSFETQNTISLFSGTLRDGSGTPKRRLSDLSEPWLIRLALAPDEQMQNGFSMSIYRGSTRIFTVDSVTAYQNVTGHDARALLPKSIFSPGQFQITLYNKASGKFTKYPITFE